MLHPKLPQPSLKRTASDSRRPQYLLSSLFSGSFILSFNRLSPICSPFNNNNLIENHYEVCLIPIKEIFRFKFNTEMFSRFQEMNDAKLFDDSCYDNSATEVTKVLSEYINSMNWKTGDRVLDLGCGPGSVTTKVLMPRLPEDFGLLVGADLSADMIQYAKERYTHPKLRFTQFDLTKDIGNTSQLRPSEFDKIFSFFCLHWIPNHSTKKALSNIHSLLRTGGETLLVFLGSHPVFKVLDLLSRKPEWQPYMKDAHQFVSPYQNSSDPGEDFSKLLHDTGFEVIDCQSRDTEYTFDTVSRFRDAMKSGNPYLDCIPRELHEQYMTDYIAEFMNMAEINKTTDDGVVLKRGLIVAFARKS